MRKLVRPLSIVLIIVNLLFTPLSAFAATGSGGTVSVNSLLSKWKGYGVLGGSFTDSDLSKPIQKIDFITFINSLLKPSKQADIGFSDVPEDSWYGAEIAKAVAAGYVSNQDKTNYEPFSNISRLDAAIMVARVFELELNDKTMPDRITDAEKLDSEQLTEFGAVVEKGCLSEISDGRYVPMGVLKLGDALKMLDKCVGQFITKSTTINNSVQGNILINADAVNLKNMTVNGDLIIGNGNINLETVTVKGRLIVKGSGSNGLALKNTQVADDLIVERTAGDVKVELSGTSTVEKTLLKSGAALSENNLTSGKGFVDVRGEHAVINNETATLKGNFNNVALSESNINIKLSGNVENVSISKDSDSDLSINGNAKSVSTKASRGTIELLGGTTSAVNVEAGAKGNKIVINGASATTVNLKENTVVSFDKGTVDKLTFETTAGGSTIKLKDGAVLKNFYANSDVAVSGQGRIYNAYLYSKDVSMGIKPSGTYFVNGQSTNIDGSIASTNPSQINIYGNNKTIQKGKTEKVNAVVFPADCTLSYSSSDKSIATVDDKGMLTANSVGKTTIHISAKKDGYQPNVTAIQVTVTSDNITVSGALAITPATGEAGKTNDFTLTYTAGDNMSNGTVVIRLPAGFTALETDTVAIGTSAEKPLGSAQAPSSLLFGNLNLAKGETIVVKLKNKIVPASGQYEFSAVSDADGTGPKLPTAGDEKVIFTSDSMRTLVEGINYSKPEYGSTGGTMKISTLSFIGIENFTNDFKWIINVQSGTITPPKYNDKITGTEYQQGQNITAASGQNLLLAAVDASNMVKGYAIIAITDSIIRPYDAGELVAGTNYKIPEIGVQANTTRINDLNYTGADHWMIKVQDTELTSVFVNTKFTGTVYTGGNDIKVNPNQHILLAAVDSKDTVIAYKDIAVTADMVSTAAGTLLAGNNYSVPSIGADKGTTLISTLRKGDDVGGFTKISKWMTVLLDNAAVVPSKNATTDDYSKYYLADKSFTAYAEGKDITASAGQHLLLVGVDDANAIQAYADIKIDSSYIRQADAPAIPDGDYSIPEKGSEAGTSMISVLNFSTAITGATKYMAKVQAGAVVPQVNSLLPGAVDYTSKQNISITAGQHLILVATDADGKIKAYKDLTVDLSQIRPKDAFKLSIDENDYSAPVPGSDDGSTKIVLNSTNIPRDKVADTRTFDRWVYMIQGTQFAVPYDGSDLPSGTTPKVTVYTSGANIPKEEISAGQYILILAIDKNDKVMAYTQELITAKQIKQAKATDLKNPDNYTDPVAGLVKNTTRIMSLSLMGINGATKWLYQVSNTAAAAPDYNSPVSGSLYQYIDGQGGASIVISKSQYIVLYAVDSDNRVKAYKNIQVNSDSQIKTEVALMKAGYNYTVAQGSVQGTAVFSALSFVSLVGQDPATWKWQYAVGDKAFIAPAVNTTEGAIGVATNTYVFDTVNSKYPDITVKAGQYILLLAVDSSNIIQGYANILVAKEQIKPAPADIIPPTNYSIVKGTSEGTTRFETLSRIGLSSEAKKWMYKKQSSSFNTDTNPIPRDTRITDAADYNDTLKPNITVSENDHILLLATDTYGYIKAYCDITVTKDKIQNPFATEMVLNTNYTNPQPGTSPGAISLTLKPTGIPTDSTILWKYQIGTAQFSVPHLDDTVGDGYQPYTSNGNIQAKANDYLLVVAVNQSDNKIKAYKLFKISETQIKPAEAALLEEGAGNNYTAPVPGSEPGTTKIGNLSTIGLSSEASKWQVKVFADIPQALLLNSTITYPTSTNYTGGNIPVKDGQYVVLAAVDANNRVKAYASIKIAKEQINAPLADELVLNTNYSSPKYGVNKGTTSIKVSPPSGTSYVLKVADAGELITAGQPITVTALTGIDYSVFHKYVSNTDIAAKEGQYILLVAIDSSSNALAFKNIPIGSAVNPGLAVALTENNNYVMQAGTGAGTTRFTELDYIGVDVGDTNTAKWVYKVQSTAAATPLINSSVDGGYVVDNKDITVNEGQYILLYALNGQNLIKGFACIEVKSGSVKGVASSLKIDSQPVPGSDLSTMKLDATVLDPVLATVTLATKWMYVIQDAQAGTILKDSALSGAQNYTPGSNITAAAGKHLILAATDKDGLVKAFADITVTTQMLKNVSVTLSGTIITVPTGESDIAAGGRTIIVKLDSGEWQDDIITNQTRRNMLFSGFKASGTEATKWDTNVITNSLIKAGASAATLTDSKTVTIVLSQAAYDITQNQQVTFTVNKDLVKNAVLDVASGNIIKIAANVVVQPLGGTAVTQGLNQNDVATGGKTIIVTLSNGEFAQDVASDADKRNAIFDGFKTSNSVTTMWDKVIAALKSSGTAAINRNAPNVITITLPPVSGYVLSTNELISLTIPYKTSTDKEILVGAIKGATAPAPFTVSADTIASLSGTLLSAPVSEADIAAGNKTLVITLTDGQWASDIATDKTKREALFTGLKLNGTIDATQWNNVIAALKTASALTGQTTIVRDSDSVVTIKLPPVSTYKITANQSITVNIPATSIVGAKNTLTAGQGIIIERLGTAALSGTVAGAAEGTVRTGGKTLVITLAKATWASDVVTDTTKRDALLNGLTAGSETGIWNLVVDELKNTDGSVQRTSDTVVTITLPPVSGYDITANQLISVTVPTCAAIGTSFEINGTNKLTITNAVTPATVTKVEAVTPSTAYKAGGTVDINVIFDNAVVVTGTTKPTIKLETGTTDRNAAYESGSGTNTLLFRYIVQAGDENAVLDYVAGTTIVVPSGTTVVNKGTTTSVNKALPAVGAGRSLSKSQIAIDGVAPVFATGSPVAGDKTETEANFTAKVGEAGTLCYVVLPAGATAPSAAQVTLKQDSAGNPVTVSGEVSVQANTDAAFKVSGLAAYTTYNIYMVPVDTMGNIGALKSLNFKTLDLTAPGFYMDDPSKPMQVTPISDNKIEIKLKTTEDATVYMVALPKDSAAPTSAQVKDFKDAAGNVVALANLKLSGKAVGNTETRFTLTGLSFSSHYDIYLTCVDASNNITTAPAIVLDAKTSKLVLDNVHVDLVSNKLLNTNTDMQYSLDGAKWSSCSSSVTIVSETFTYDDTDINFYVYLRDAKDIINNTRTIELKRQSNSVIDWSKIDYDIAAGTITNNSDIKLEYRFNKGVWMPLNDRSTAANVKFASGDFDLRTAVTLPATAAEDSKMPSDPKTVDSIPEKGEAPALTYSDTNNKIDNLSGIYEYNVNEGTTWVSGDIVLKDCFAGTKKVKVRYKATAAKLPSKEQVIQFTANVITAVASPATATNPKKSVTITFEENTNKANQTLTAQQVKDWFVLTDALGVQHEWGTDLQGKFNSTGNVLTISFNSMTDSTIDIGDVITVTAAAGIQNTDTNNPSGAYTSTGTLEKSFNTVPKVLTIKAQNTNGDAVFSNGEKLVITFDQDTNQSANPNKISAANIATYLIVKDSTGKFDRKWSKSGTPKVTLAWTGNNILTIVFNDVTDTDLIVGDKIWVNTAWGLKDITGTTDPCNSSQNITGSFTAP